MIIHVPHAATAIPAHLRGQFVLNEQALTAELLRSTDWYTDELFATDSAVTIRYPISRLVVDPERFEADAEEPMSVVGRGVIYRNRTDGGPLRRAITGVERERVLDAFYRPHHRALECAVERELVTCGCAMLIDAHSFPNTPWWVEPSRDSIRPDFCLGTDYFHTPAEMIASATNFLVRSGFSVSHNLPYGGTMIPVRYYRKNPRVRGLMVEVNRRLYMDEESGRKNPDFPRIKKSVQLLCRLLSALPV